MATDRQEAPSANLSGSLEGLLCDLFPSYKAFDRFVREILGSEKLVHELPNPESSESLAQLMFAAVAVLRGAGCLDATFFVRLADRFPRRRRSIRAEAERWGAASSSSSSLQIAPIAAAKQGRTHSRWIVMGLGLLVAGLSAGVWISGHLYAIDDPSRAPMSSPTPVEPVEPVVLAEPPRDKEPRPSDTDEPGDKSKKPGGPEPDAKETGTKPPPEKSPPKSVTKPPPRVDPDKFKQVVEGINDRECQQLCLLGGGDKGAKVIPVRASISADGNSVITVDETIKSEPCRLCVQAAVLKRVKTEFAGKQGEGLKAVVRFE